MRPWLLLICTPMGRPPYGSAGLWPKSRSLGFYAPTGLCHKLRPGLGAAPAPQDRVWEAPRQGMAWP